MENTSTRLKKALNLRNLKQIDIVERTGINKGALSSYISGKYEPKQTNIYLLAKALDVNEAWLMGYDVPMERDSLPENAVNIEVLEAIENNTGMSLKELAALSKDKLLDLRISTYFNKLNDKGKLEATKRVKELTYIPTYCNDTPEHLKVVAAHNDFADDEEQQRLMQEDLDDL